MVPAASIPHCSRVLCAAAAYLASDLSCCIVAELPVYFDTFWLYFADVDGIADSCTVISCLMAQPLALCLRRFLKN